MNGKAPRRQGEMENGRWRMENGFAWLGGGRRGFDRFDLFSEKTGVWWVRLEILIFRRTRVLGRDRVAGFGFVLVEYRHGGAKVWRHGGVEEEEGNVALRSGLWPDGGDG